MRRDLWWKIALIVAVLVIFTAAIIPTKNDPERIPLGLDLKGGTHLVMQVNTADALRAEVDQAIEAVKVQTQKSWSATGCPRSKPRALRKVSGCGSTRSRPRRSKIRRSTRPSRRSAIA